jgi:hypothetical protein
MGAGKSTVMGEASAMLADAGVRHAALDLDFLGVGHYDESEQDEVMYRNLASVWRNYAAAGARHALICKPIDTTVMLDRIGHAIPRSELVVCRLRAGLATMQERVRIREPGHRQEHFVEHVARLEEYLDAARLEDFSVVNDDRPVNEVARELLERAGWLPA